MALKQAMTPEFRIYQRQVVANCRALAETLMELGYTVVTGTSRHLAAPPARDTRPPLMLHEASHRGSASQAVAVG